MFKLIFTGLLFSFFFDTAIAQQVLSQEGAERMYIKALNLYQDQYYASAVGLFDQYLDAGFPSYKSEASYYLAYSRLKLGDKGGIKQIESFIKTEKNHPLALTGYFVLGNHFFNQKEFDEALKYYTKVNENQLSISEQEEWHFKKGYVYLVKDDQRKAQEAFERTVDYRGDYFQDASYYLGQLYYQQKNYSASLTALEPIDQPDSPYANQITGLMASCYFQQRNYNQLYKYADDRMTNTINEANKTLSRLVGEAYFNQEKFSQAARNLQRHVDFSRNKAEAEVYFKLAFACFKNGDDQRAIDYFKLAGLEKGSLGQASSFYLGQLYLRTDNSNYAYSAFKRVMQSGEDRKMAEEAAFLVGKINYDRQQFGDAITDFRNFLEQYPNSLWGREANELLAQAYLNTSNFDQAIKHLEGINNKSAPLKKAYQKVTFQKGQLQFNDARFNDAAVSFEKSVAFPVDEEIAGEAYYLLGDSYSQIGRTSKAISAYERAKRYPGSTWSLYADYGLGYLYYNQKNYRKAEDYFSSFVDRVSKASDYFLDGKLRLADCNYVRKDYDEAIRLYNEVKSQTAYQRDYIFYQLGLAYNLKGDQTQSRIAFRNVLNQGSSAYADNALFQLAQTFIEGGNFDKAASHLDQLIREYPNNNIAPYARSKRALCYFNLGQLNKAKNDYQYILNNNINHPAANAALLGLQEIVKKGENVSGFDQYMREYQQANPDDGSLEVIAFESAKGKYYNQRYQEAIDALKTYIRKYPSSGFIEDAYYFLADSYYRNQDWRQAAEYFQQITSFDNTPYLSRALDKRGKALMNMSEVDDAISNYRRLERLGTTPKDIYLAQEGLMKAYDIENNADSTLYYADQILQNDWKPAVAQTMVWITRGKVFLKQKNYVSALDEFVKVVNESRNEQGAEAKYLMGKVYYEQGNHKRSLETLFDLNKNYGSYSYWIGKSFLLIADNYFAMNELLQAEATLNSIIENAGNDEFIRQARQKLRKVNAEEEKVLVQDSTKGDSIK